MSAKNLFLLWLVFVLAPVTHASDCADKKFIGVAGARLREQAKSEAKVLQVLKFNEAVCVSGASGDFVSVTSGTDSTVTGWISKKFLVSKATPENEAIEKTKQFIKAKDKVQAVQWAERIVDIAEDEVSLKLLQDAATLAGDSDRAATIESKISVLNDPQILYVSGTTTYAGTDYQNNSAWFAVTCEAGACQAKNTALKIKSAGVQGYGDDSPQPAQEISAKGSEGALFLVRGVKGLRAGALKTYYNRKMGSPPAGKSGSEFETQLKIPGQEPVVLVGRLMASGINYYIEQGKKKQHLGVFETDVMAGNDGLPNAKQFLVWAGDMDADGKPDFVLELTSRYGEYTTRTLYLSTHAKAEEIAGQAAKFEYWPPENPGC